MYFETTVHTEKQIAGAREAAELIKAGALHGYEALTWTNTTNWTQYFVVNDAGCNYYHEVAIIVKQQDGTFVQIESLTAGWIKTVEELSKSIEECFQEPAMQKPVKLMFNQVDPTAVANFTCGCCGEWFKGNVAKQLTYGQDTGYGICPSCEKYH